LVKVSKRSIEQWTENIRRKEDDERDQQILELYLECKTQQEIADETENSVGNINNIVNKFKKRILAEIENNPPDSLQIENLPLFSNHPQLH